MLFIEHIRVNQYMFDVILLSMLSTPSYFKLKSKLRLAAEYDPSTYIEFELRRNSAASNLRYKTVLPL